MEHLHCVLQVFLSFDEPLQVIVGGERLNGKCIIINKNVQHEFSCSNTTYLSILIEPCSNFAKELINQLNGDYLIFNNDLEDIQRKALMLIDTNDKEKYVVLCKVLLII